jgi:hypothetical protein
MLPLPLYFFGAGPAAERTGRITPGTPGTKR